MFYVALKELNKDSVPGYCEMSNFGSTNGQALGWDGCSYDTFRVDFLKTTVKLRMNKILSGEPFADPLKIFIKKEPHKLTKIQSGKLRLISAVSVVDSMVDRVLLTPLLNLVVKTFHKSQVMIGWSPLFGGHQLLDTWFHGRTEYLMADRSSWDWTFPSWLIDDCLDLIERLAPRAPEWWFVLLRGRFKLLFEEPVLRFADQTDVRIPGKGVMKSGCLLTIFMNSIAQFIMHYNACLELSWFPEDYAFVACGDDTLQDVLPNNEDYFAKLRDYGAVLKVQVGSVMEFVGFEIFKTHSIPAYIDKHLFLLSHLSKDHEIARSTLFAYQIMYAFHPQMLEHVRQIAESRGLFDAIISDRSLREYTRK